MASCTKHSHTSKELALNERSRLIGRKLELRRTLVVYYCNAHRAYHLGNNFAKENRYQLEMVAFRFYRTRRPQHLTQNYKPIW